MSTDAERLAVVVAAIEERAPAWGLGDDKVTWLEARRSALIGGTRPIEIIRDELRAICVGMGSLTDIHISDPRLAAEHQRLTDELYRLACG